MRFALIFDSVYPGDIKHAQIFSEDVLERVNARAAYAFGFLNQAHRDGDRWLTPEETAAYLLGAPAEAFVLEPCKP